MTLQKNDFVEIEFTGKIKDTGEIFDSNIKSDLESSGLNRQDAKPFVFSLGQGMFLPGIDEFLTGKPETPSKYQIELNPEKAFGPRQSQLVQLMPMKVFAVQKVRPIPGAMFNFDGRIGKVLSVSGGRVMIDFNNPIAGKTVIYDVNFLRKVEDTNEKIKYFINFLFRRDLNFKMDADKIILEVEKSMVQFVKLFEDKFKELFGVGLEVTEMAEKAKEAVQEAVGEKTLDEVEDISKEADKAE